MLPFYHTTSPAVKPLPVKILDVEHQGHDQEWDREAEPSHLVVEERTHHECNDPQAAHGCTTAWVTIGWNRPCLTASRTQPQTAAFRSTYTPTSSVRLSRS